MGKLTVALYVRVSTKEQSVKIQKEKLQEYCKLKEYDVYDEYVDEGVSGATSDRPALNRLMIDAEKGKFKAVVVHKLDRFGRSAGDLHKNVGDLKSIGVSFVSVSDSIDTSSMYGKLIFGILASFAEFERNLILERTRVGLERARKHGSKSGKPLHRPKKDINLDLLKRYYDGNKLSISACARMFNVHRITIRNRLKEMGLVE